MNYRVLYILIVFDFFVLYQPQRNKGLR